MTRASWAIRRFRPKFAAARRLLYTRSFGDFVTMYRGPSRTIFAVLVVLSVGCSSDTETTSKQGDAAAQQTGGSSGNGGTAGAAGTAGAGGVAGSTASGGATGASACARAGGVCECSCGNGTSAVFSLMNSCPQPCPTCGGCGMQCCAPNADAGSFQCGSQRCASNQFCLQPCSGTDPQPPPHCVDLPSSCGPTPTCGCLPSSLCGGAGMCTDSRIQGHMVTCFGCA